MGADIHLYGEKKNDKGEYEALAEFFDMRSYRVFGFLADVRNYSAVKPIAECRGIPDDVSVDVKDLYKIWYGDAHSASWLTLDELLNFNYKETVEDRRCTIGNNGGCTAPEGEGKLTSYKDFLGEFYFNELEKLKEAGADRVVFWFDN